MYAMGLAFLRRIFGSDTKLDEQSTRDEPKGIKDVIEDDKFVPWRHLHHALRLVVSTLKPFILSRIEILFETAPISFKNQKGKEPTNAELLEFLCSFDKRFNKDTNRRKLPKYWTTRNTLDSPFHLANTFCTMEVMENTMDFGGATSSSTKKASTLTYDSFDATAIFNIARNCDVFDHYWKGDTSLEASVKMVTFIRNKLMHNQDMTISRANAKHALLVFLDIVTNFDYDTPTDQADSFWCRDMPTNIRHLRELCDMYRGDELLPPSMSLKTSTQHRNKLKRQSSKRKAKSMTNLATKRSKMMLQTSTKRNKI